MAPTYHVAPPKTFGGALTASASAATLMQMLEEALASFSALPDSSAITRNAGVGLRTSPGFPDEGTRVTCGRDPNHASQDHPTAARPQPAHIRHVATDAAAKTSHRWCRRAGTTQTAHVRNGGWLLSAPGPTWVPGSRS